MIFRPLRWLLRIAVVRRFMPDDDDDRDQWPQRSPLSAARPLNRWEDRREEMREDTRAEQRGLDALSARKRLALIGLALAALLVIIGVIMAEAQLASRRQTSQGPGANAQVTPTATVTPQPTATPTFNSIPVNLSALGWFKRTPSWAERITTAPSAPNTVYACGGTNISTAWVISFGVSGDGGRTWTSATTSVQAAHCNNLVVSPTAPQAIAIFTDTCPSDCGQSVQQVFYSLDAGKHWLPISNSCACSQPPDDGFAIG